MAAYPDVFWLFLVLLPVIIIMITGYFNGKNNLVKSSGMWRPKEYYDLYTVKYFFSAMGFLVFIVFSILALAGFPGKENIVDYNPSGTDVIFVFDVSESMKTEDVQPSRLELSSRMVQSVCENAAGGRYGVVVFKGAGVKIIPSTEDVEAVFSFLGFLSTDILTSPGSNMQSGLDAAIESFTGGEERKKYIILLSDGESHSGDIEASVEKALAADISIYTIGAGTVEGGKIPAAEGGYVRDSSGEIVVTRLNEQNLKYLAETTGGKYYQIGDPALLSELIGLSSGHQTQDSPGYRIVNSERYKFFILIALLGLMLSRFVKVVKWKSYF